MLILFSAALFGFGMLLFSLGLAVMLVGLAIRIAIWLFQLGLLPVWASLAARHWLQQRRKLAGLLLLTGMLLCAAPAYAYDLPKSYLDAVTDAVGDYCVHHFCQPGIATQERFRIGGRRTAPAPIGIGMRRRWRMHRAG